MKFTFSPLLLHASAGPAIWSHRNDRDHDGSSHWDTVISQRRQLVEVVCLKRGQQLRYTKPGLAELEKDFVTLEDKGLAYCRHGKVRVQQTSADKQIHEKSSL